MSKQMKTAFSEAQFGCFLIIPLKYDLNSIDRSWIQKTGEEWEVKSVDLNDQVKNLFNHNLAAPIGVCYRFSREVMIHEMFYGTIHPSVHTFGVADNYRDIEANGKEKNFDFHSSFLFCFHTKIAFLCIGLSLSDIETLGQIRNHGYADRKSVYYYRNSKEEIRIISLEDGLSDFCRKAGLSYFFEDGTSPFLEMFTYTVAGLPERFPTTLLIKQLVFNLHLMEPLDRIAEDDSEEDIKYVYALKDQQLGSYGWGCCVSSQTISYIVEDKDRNLDKVMDDQVQNGLPIVLIALYEKYSCLRFSELLAGSDGKKGSLRDLKRMMLEFRAYGTIEPANISRWHNVKMIYQYMLENNGIRDAIQDINTKLDVVAEYQKERETARNELLAGCFTMFGIASIIDSVLSIEEMIKAGDRMEISVTIFVVLIIIGIVLAIIKGFENDQE